MVSARQLVDCWCLSLSFNPCVRAEKGSKANADHQSFASSASSTGCVVDSGRVVDILALHVIFCSLCICIRSVQGLSPEEQRVACNLNLFLGRMIDSIWSLLNCGTAGEESQAVSARQVFDLLRTSIGSLRDLLAIDARNACGLGQPFGINQFPVEHRHIYATLHGLPDKVNYATVTNQERVRMARNPCGLVALCSDKPNVHEDIDMSASSSAATTPSDSPVCMSPHFTVDG